MALKVALLVFCACSRWLAFAEGPVPEPTSEECTSGFIPLDRLTALSRIIATHHQQQRIIPNINFTCNGVITKWIVGAQWDGNDWYPDLQLWRETGNRTYIKVGNTTLRVGTESTSGVYEYPVDPPLEFQAGDILGIFQPTTSESRIRVDYELSNGPLNYFVFTGVEAVEPPLEEFTIEGTIEGSQIQTQDATPLVAVEISSTQGDVLQCTCGFMSLERLVILQTPLITNNRQQRIFPQINFTCDGNITKWIMGALQSSNRDYFPELQIWRDSGNNTYTKVGNTPPGNATPFLQDMTTNAYEYTPEHLLEFQAGDILGVFQPRGALSRLRVYYEENNGPTSFDVRVDEADTEPLLDKFTLTQSGVRTSSDLPLITVEIAQQETPIPSPPPTIIPTTTPASPVPAIIPTTTPASPVPGQTSPPPDVVTDEQESLPLTAIGGAVSAAAVAIAVIVVLVILTALVCAARKKTRNWTTPPHMENVDNEMKENVAYGQHSEIISTSENEAYGTKIVNQNEAYGAANVDDGSYENYDYARI